MSLQKIMTSYLSIGFISQTIFHDHVSYLTHLIGFRFISIFLEVHLLLNICASENMVTASRSFLKSKTFKKAA